MKTPYFYWYLLLHAYKNQVDLGKRESIFDTLHVFSIVIIVVWFWLKWLGQTNVWRSRKQFIWTALWIKKCIKCIKTHNFPLTLAFYFHRFPSSITSTDLNLLSQNYVRNCKKTYNTDTCICALIIKRLLICIIDSFSKQYKVCSKHIYNWTHYLKRSPIYGYKVNF